MTTDEKLLIINPWRGRIESDIQKRMGLISSVRITVKLGDISMFYNVSRNINQAVRALAERRSR